MSFLTLEFVILFLKVLNIPSNNDFPKCRREIAVSLNDFSNIVGAYEKMLNLMP